MGLRCRENSEQALQTVEDPTEIEDRREVANEWEHLEDRILIVRAALNEYDWATKRDSIPL